MDFKQKTLLYKSGQSFIESVLREVTGFYVFTLNSKAPYSTSDIPLYSQSLHATSDSIKKMDHESENFKGKQKAFNME